MDPNVALENLRCALVRPVDADGARQAFYALDEWLINGGFLPDEWNRR